MTAKEFNENLSKLKKEFGMTHEEISKQCPYPEEHYKRCWVEGYIAALKALDRPLDVVPELRPTVWSEGYRHGYDDAVKDMQLRPKIADL